MHKGVNTTCDEGQTMIPTMAIRTAQTSANGHGIAVDVAHTLDQAQGQAIAFNWQNGGGYGEANDGLGISHDHTPPMSRSQVAAVAFHENQRAEVTTSDTAGSLKIGGGKPGQGYPAIQTGMQVRRLTPRECERLQGFPDDYHADPLSRQACRRWAALQGVGQFDGGAGDALDRSTDRHAGEDYGMSGAPQAWNRSKAHQQAMARLLAPLVAATRPREFVSAAAATDQVIA
jgi:hypothetical protein